MIMAVAGGPATDVSAGPGPTAAPSSGVFELLGGDDYGLAWVNGDPTSSTQIAFKTPPGEPPAGEYIVSPGVTAFNVTFETGLDLNDDTEFWYVRHVKNGQYSAWSAAIGPEE